MTGTIIGFIIWCICGCFFIGMGIYAFFAKKAVGFWANAKMFEVTDVKKYNAAMGKLYCIMGLVFIALGLPLLSEEHILLIMFSSVGVMVEVIVAMMIYTTVIEKKYKRKS